VPEYNLMPEVHAKSGGGFLPPAARAFSASGVPGYLTGLLRDPHKGGLTRKKPFIRSAHKVLNCSWPSLEQAQFGIKTIKPCCFRNRAFSL